MAKAKRHPVVTWLSTMAKHRLGFLGFDLVKDGWKLSNLGEPVGRISSSAVTPCSEPVTNATRFQLVCSYNWRRTRNPPGQHGRAIPEIAVPGMAPTFLPFELPRAVCHDTTPRGSRDANLFKLPKAPYDAMFCAMSAMSPGIRLDDVDVIVTRGALTRLLKTAQGKRESMRQNLHMVNNTLVIFRQWDRLWEENASNNVGRTFEHVFARHSSYVEGLRSHHRAILYNLGPLRCLVLLEVDATLIMPRRRRKPKGWALSGIASLQRQLTTPPLRHQRRKARISKLSASRRRQVLMPSKRYPKGRTSKQSASRTGPSTIASHHSEGRKQSRAERAIFRSLDDTSLALASPRGNVPVRMVYDGIGSLSSLTCELVTHHTQRGDATKSSKKASRKNPQMWFGRTPFMVKGRYSVERGRFTSGFILNTAKRVKRFEHLNQEYLRKLVTILQRLRVLTQKTMHKQAVAVSPRDSSGLQVFETKTKVKLPISQCWIRQFWTREPKHPRVPFRGQELPRSPLESHHPSALSERS